MGFVADESMGKSPFPTEKGDTSTDGGNLHHEDMECCAKESHDKGTHPAGRGTLGGEEGVPYGVLTTFGGV